MTLDEAKGIFWEQLDEIWVRKVNALGMRTKEKDAIKNALDIAFPSNQK
jgi:hypothetical protein